MNISVIGVTKANLMSIITDDSVYVIKRSYFDENRYKMISVKETEVKDLLSDEVLIVKITKE